MISLSAFAVIYIKHKNRIMNIDIEKTEENLSIELNKHKKLLDMKSKLLEKKLVTQNIEESLGMEIPSKKKIIYLNLVE
ncbi:MAG: hypothetical protein ACJ0QT_02055 [Gammaproteobacteria bacterium]